MASTPVDLRSIFLNEIAAVLVNKVEKFKMAPQKASQIGKTLSKYFPELLINEDFVAFLKKAGDFGYPELTEYINSFLNSYEFSLKKIN